jgi:hypothetical protein
MSEEGQLDTGDVVAALDDLIEEVKWLQLWLLVTLTKRELRERYREDDFIESIEEGLATNEAKLAEVKDHKLSDVRDSAYWLAYEIARRIHSSDPSDDKNLPAYWMSEPDLVERLEPAIADDVIELCQEARRGIERLRDGLTLAAISASNMRHGPRGVARTAHAALHRKAGIPPHSSPEAKPA